MYERNAIVLDRYFNQMFGYNMKNNIKTNFNDYSELVEALEQYKNISEEEEIIIQEYDAIANRIREIQRTQENLNKKNLKAQEERAEIFQNIGDNSGAIQKKLDNVNSTIEGLNEDIKENAQKFVDIVTQFNEKSAVRTSCGKTRRNLEGEYNKKLNETLDHYQDIDADYERKAKEFLDMDTKAIEKEIKEKMQKNGEKEKIPFNEDVLEKAITLSIDIQKRETDILTNIYDRTNRLFTEIKNNSIKSDKHKKSIKDAKSKLDFISAIKEYLIQFLDNERLTAVNGEEEHDNLMKEACKNLDEDLVQINNLYTLIIKEGAKKITKKSYAELYNVEYIRELEKKAEEFENEIKKFNLPVTIINPNYWRIEGMKKIYDTFYKCVTEIYERDLSEYMPEEEEAQIEDEEIEEEEIAIEEPETKEVEEKSKGRGKGKGKKEDSRTEIDKKIDKILGYSVKDEEEEDIYDDDDYEYEDEDYDYDEEDDDDFLEDDEDYEEDEDFDEDEDYDEDDDDDFGDEDEIEDEEIEEEEENDDDDVNFDIWGNDISKARENLKQTKSKKKQEEDEDDDFGDEEDEDVEENDDFEDEEENLEEDEEFEDEEIIEDEEDFEDDEEEVEDEEEEEEKTKSKTKGRGKAKGKEKEAKSTSTSSKKGKHSKEEDWGDEFVNIDNKDKEKGKKKKGFFEKFKK